MHIMHFDNFDNQNQCLKNPWLFQDLCHFLTNSMTIPGLENKNQFPWLFQAVGTLYLEAVVEFWLSLWYLPLRFPPWPLVDFFRDLVLTFGVVSILASAVMGPDNGTVTVVVVTIDASCGMKQRSFVIKNHRYTREIPEPTPFLSWYGAQIRVLWVFP